MPSSGTGTTLKPHLERFAEAVLLDLADDADDQLVPIGRLLIELFEAEEKGYEYPPGVGGIERRC